MSRSYETVETSEASTFELEGAVVALALCLGNDAKRWVAIARICLWAIELIFSPMLSSEFCFKKVYRRVSADVVRAGGGNRARAPVT